MRLADALRLSLNRLKRRWARSLFAVVIFVAAVTPILVMLNLVDGAERAIQAGNRAYFASTRSLSVAKTAATFDKADEDGAFLRGLPGYRADALGWNEAANALQVARLLLDDGLALSQLQGLTPPFFTALTSAGSPVAARAGEIPLVLGRLGVLYGEYGKRRDVDVDSLVDRVFELRVGERWVDDYTIEDPKTGAMRRRTEEEQRAAVAARRKALEPHFHWERFCEVLTLRARVVAIAEGWPSFIPDEDAGRIEDWCMRRAREASKTPSPPVSAEKTRSRYVHRRLLFDSATDATAALPALEERGFSAGGYAVVAEAARQQFRTVSLLITAVASFIALLACVVIAGVVSRLVADSTHEIGVLRALGARRRLVTRICLLQAAAIATAGAAISLVAGTVGAAAISAWVLARARIGGAKIELMGHSIQVLREDLVPSTLHEFSLWQLPTLAAAVLLALLAAWVPAHRAARLDPTEALRAR